MLYNVGVADNVNVAYTTEIDDHIIAEISCKSEQCAQTNILSGSILKIPQIDRTTNCTSHYRCYMRLMSLHDRLTEHMQQVGKFNRDP